jgi:hypothetical protein
VLAADTPERLAVIIAAYFTEHPTAVVLDNGSVLFDMRWAKYSVAESHGRCILQLWSDERNMVRSVVSAELRAGGLKVATRRMGVTRPETLELAPTSDRRTPKARDAARLQYLRLLARTLERHFPECRMEGLRAATDLEHSFGPAYARGLLTRGSKGMAAEALIGIGAQESAAAIDGVLTLGLLWLDHCREHAAARRQQGSRHVGGLRIVVPAGSWRRTAERIQWLHPGLASYRLFELDERTEELTEVDYRNVGNIDSRLVHAFNVPAALERAQTGIARLMDLVPQPARSRVEVRANSPGEVGLLLHGLEFARVRHGFAPNSFTRQHELSFGAGPSETPLNEETEAMCRSLLVQLFLNRHPDGPPTNPLFRLQPERWLESRIRTRLADFLPTLCGEFLYSQVPAIGAGERGMLDLLTIDHQGRLTILEVKADEDMHLPLQGLDYWIRVRALNADRHAGGPGAFERQGYFPGAQLSPAAPRLVMVAPSLRIHPANAIVLRYLSPEVDWELVAVGEHWRRELKIVFRKRAGSPINSESPFPS